ncbi:MAG TPA: HAD-IC family P-type ATPase, partial [Candidatus Pacearchaeota archaeon]|nr:HAD-IC family P-type ATPase [Candidatus Pacearchaeota archaeon]
FVIVVNVLMGFFQEYNAKKTLTALKKILKPKAIVIRNGERKEIEAKELVPGDLVVLGSGDRVPADGKLIEGVNLLVNEAILTGEEEAIIKTEAENKNLLFMGTTVISGSGVMEVTKIGKETEMGKIGKDLVEIKEEKTPLQGKLEVFAKTLAIIVLCICVFIFLFGVFEKHDPLEMFKMAVILSIAAIPEGLPIITTMILAMGMRRILKKNGLVKSLLSLETLGSTSVICTDKTGTLTEGKMKVVKTDFKDKEKALLVLTLDNEQRSSLEVALWDYVKKENKFNPQEVFDTRKRIYEEPFDSEKKYSMTINNFEGKETAFLMGAPDIIAPFCQLSNEERNKLQEKIEKWADEGLRILGVAFKEKGDLKEKKDFTWLGLVGIADPLRKEAKESILTAQKAGIKVKIVTGDYRKTAERIAKNLGFKIEPKNVLEGEELEKISEEELKERIDDIILFTRVTPHQKYKIVKALQEKGEIVAMTGDGANDALALKKANIGVAVGTASDVAKEAADLILLDNNFKTIVAACEEGRLIFSNIKKSVGYVLSNSFAEIALIFGGVLLGFPTPLTVVQILWIHLICDGPPDLALAFESKEKSLMEKTPQEIQKEGILDNFTKILIAAISLSVGILSLFLFWNFGVKEGNIKLGQTIAFASIAIVSLVYVFAYKNLEKPIIKTENFFKNKFMFFSVVYGFLLIGLAVYLPFLNKVLGTVPLEPFYWLIIFGIAVFATLVVELTKILKNKNVENNK